MSEDRSPSEKSARDLVRKRARSYKREETGRHHHIGAAPERQPMLTEDGGTLIGTSAVQLASRTLTQLEQQRATTAAQMEQAAADLRFEDAARLRDDLAAVDAELERRT